MVSTRYLNVTYRQGEPFAAYLQLTGGAKKDVARTRREQVGMLVDYDAAEVPIGIEFIAPSLLSLTTVNTLLASLGQEAASHDELWPVMKQTES
jgi:hypothetical protein